MTRCEDFYTKWNRAPNWCEKCPAAVSEINSYLELVDRMEADGINRSFAYANLSENAARPLYRHRDPEVREKAISLIENELNRTTPQGGKRHKSKPLTVADVAKIVRDVELREHREELFERAADVEVDPDSVQVHALDFLLDYHILGEGSIDCIITDPPYVKDWLPNYEAFGEAAAYVLKPGGFCILYVGHIHLDRILAALTPSLEYFWTMVLLHAGTTAAVHSRSVQCGYKPVLVLHKEPFSRPKRYFNDVLQGTGKEKEGHDWQQGEEELRQIFEPFTDPGDTVLDPFCGSGTVLAMARKMQRRAIGFDIVPENARAALARAAIA